MPVWLARGVRRRAICETLRQRRVAAISSRRATTKQPQHSHPRATAQHQTAFKQFSRSSPTAPKQFSS
eukprot:1233078-Lingulodinium_polyedra.AAC.1